MILEFSFVVCFSYKYYLLYKPDIYELHILVVFTCGGNRKFIEYHITLVTRPTSPKSRLFIFSFPSLSLVLALHCYSRVQ